MTSGTIVSKNDTNPFKGYCGQIFRYINRVNVPETNLSCILVEMAPGEISDLHHHNKSQEIYFVIEGKGQIRLGDRTIIVNPGDAVHIPTRVKHSIENDGEILMQLFVVNSPPYQENDVIFEEN